MRGNRKKAAPVLTEGSIVGGMLAFLLPLLLGQALQSFYNIADAWVVGHYADTNAFAAVSSAGNLIFLVTGFFAGIGTGGGVVISRYYGAGDGENTGRAIHSLVLLGLVSCAVIAGVCEVLVPEMLTLLAVPEEVLPDALLYYRIYFGGVGTVVLYNICMAVMQALGDSRSPLEFLLISSLLNIALDLLLVAGFRLGVGGAAAATVAAQGFSCVLCFLRMVRRGLLKRRELRFTGAIVKELLIQGLPAGIQNSIISVSNVFIQSHINSFGAAAMAGHGAYARLDSITFLPISCISMALPTFVSQNLGARKFRRARKGALLFLGIGMAAAELVGMGMYTLAPRALGIFISDPEAIAYGTSFLRTIALFDFLLAFSHCGAGILRGLGKSFIPMVTMVFLWCGVRIAYLQLVLPLFPEFTAIAWAYPITWSLSTAVFLVFLLRTDWSRGGLEA